MPLSDTAPPVVEPDAPLLVSIATAEKMLDLSRGQVTNLLNRGLMESRYIGRRRLIVLASLNTFVENLPREPDEG